MKEKGIVFSQLSHKPCLTSQESADVRGVTLESGAKVILLKNFFKQIIKKKALLFLDKKTQPPEYFLCVMSAAKRLSRAKMRKIRNSKKMDIATKE